MHCYGEEVVTAGPGTWVFKPPRAVAHVLEHQRRPYEMVRMISPGGYEDFFPRTHNRIGQPGNDVGIRHPVWAGFRFQKASREAL